LLSKHPAKGIYLFRTMTHSFFIFLNIAVFGTRAAHKELVAYCK